MSKTAIVTKINGKASKFIILGSTSYLALVICLFEYSSFGVRNQFFDSILIATTILFILCLVLAATIAIKARRLATPAGALLYSSFMVFCTGIGIMTYTGVIGSSIALRYDAYSLHNNSIRTVLEIAKMDKYGIRIDLSGDTSLKNIESFGYQIVGPEIKFSSDVTPILWHIDPAFSGGDSISIYLGSGSKISNSEKEHELKQIKLAWGLSSQNQILCFGEGYIHAANGIPNQLHLSVNPLFNVVQFYGITKASLSSGESIQLNPITKLSTKDLDKYYKRAILGISASEMRLKAIDSLEERKDNLFRSFMPKEAMKVDEVLRLMPILNIDSIYSNVDRVSSSWNEIDTAIVELISNPDYSYEEYILFMSDE